MRAWSGRHETVVLGATKAAADEFVRAHANGGLLGVHALTLTHFAASTAAPVMAERGLAPLSRLGAEAVAARVTHAALQQAKLTYFTPVADTPGFARAVARTVTEIRLNGLAASDLKRGGAPGADMAYLLLLYQDELRERALADTATMFAIATEHLGQGHHALKGLPIVLLDVAVDYELQRKFLARAKEHAPAVFEALLGEEPERCSGTPLDRIRSYLFAPDAPKGEAADADVIFSAPGEGLECVEIARRIRALSEQGTRFDKIAILLRDPDLYQPLVEEALRRAGIPDYFSRGSARPDPAGRAFLALLACADEGCSASRFAEYLSLGQVPPLDHTGAPPRTARVWVSPEDEVFPLPSRPEQANGAEENGTDEPAFAAPANWEKLLVDASVIGGYERWQRRLRGLENELRLKLAEAAGEDEGTRAYLERQLAHLGNLERFALPLIEFLHALPKTALWRDWLDRLSELAGMSLRAPEPVLSVLNELQPMGDVGPAALGEVYGVLAERLGMLRREPARRRYGRVFTGAIEEARGRVFDVVFLPGLAEGLFPRRNFEDPLLLDDKRQSVSDLLERGDQRAARERILLRIAAAAASKALVASYPRVNVAQSRPRVPSFYALEILRAAEGRLPNLREFEKRAARGAPTRLDWPAPKDPAEAIDDAEYDLAWLKAASNGKGSGRYLVEESAEVSRFLADSLRVRWRRWDHKKWHAADGIVDLDAAARAALSVYRLGTRAYSASSLQQFSSCPYRFYLYAIQRLRPREAPAALEQMDPLTRGSLFHAVQFQLLRELDAAGLLPFPPEAASDVLDRADAVLDRVAGEYAEMLVPAVPRVWKSEIEDVRTDLRGWLQHVAESSKEWQPAYFELAFGLRDDTPRDPHSIPEDIALSCGVRLHGAIDVVERHRARNVLRVTDHKTGKRPERPPAYVGGGAVLQPILYSLAAEAMLETTVERGRLFYCTQRGDYTEVEIPLTIDARDRIAQVVAAIDEAIDRGFLPAAPGKNGCAYCDYQAVCGPYEEQRTSRKPGGALTQLNALRSLP